VIQKLLNTERRILSQPKRSASQQSEENAQPAKKRVSKRVKRAIGDSYAPPQSEMNAQPTENRVNTLVTDPSDPRQTEEITQPTKKSVRGATRMAHFLLIEKLMLSVLYRKHPVKFDLNESEFLYLPTRDIMELCIKTEELCLTILRIWVV